MNQQSIDLSNELVVTLFHHSLFVTGLLWITLIAMTVMAVVVLTRVILNFNLSPAGRSEPRARTYLRWAFGAIWLFDGILQFQASMPLGLANNVLAPATANTPSWLNALMEHGIFLWNTHPIALAVAVAWLQVGLGLALLVSKGAFGRVAAGGTVVWAAVIWLIGNGAGGIFAPGGSLLFGWPGATFFYAAAGVWLAVRPDTFQRLYSVVTRRALSILLLVAVILQCLPSGEFWHGGNSNALTTMTSTMSKVAQPHWLAFFVRRVGTLSGVMGGGFNLIVILWLLVCAVGIWMSLARGWNWPLWTLVVGCVFFWVFVQDTAIFGGIATDINSLIPLAVLAACATPKLQARDVRTRLLPVEITNSAGAVVAVFASAMILFSSILMAGATFASAENTLYEAHNGTASQVSGTAYHFTLTDQFDKSYSIGEHPSHVTLLTFLDPHCWTDCPLLAKQLEQVRSDLSANAKIDIVAVAADPYHEKISDLRHFIAIRGLAHVKNFYFVTGKLASVKKVWAEYGIGVEMQPTDKMSIHSDLMYIITPSGELRWIIPDDPLDSKAGTASAVAELRGLLADEGVH
jgi:cytochrome oxidase Cu insertion factor (SCO1/SenC/PrrC family)